MPDLNSTFSISPHNKIPEAQPPHSRSPKPWIKHGVKKEPVTKYYPIRGKVIYCTCHSYCFRSSLCPDQCCCKSCRTHRHTLHRREKTLTEDRRENICQWFLDGWTAFELESVWIYIDFQCRTEAGRNTQQWLIHENASMLEQDRDLKFTYRSPQSSCLMICSLFCFL